MPHSDDQARQHDQYDGKKDPQSWSESAGIMSV
jgi:hypothetical protein